jgi:hypothetical protein
MEELKKAIEKVLARQSTFNCSTVDLVLPSNTKRLIWGDLCGSMGFGTFDPLRNFTRGGADGEQRPHG